MRKDKLIELAQESLAGGDVSAELRGKYPKPVIELYLDMAYSDVMQEEFEKAGSDMTIFDNAARPYKVLVDYNKDTEMRFFALPVQLIPLRPNQAAIRSISMYKGQQVAFAPISNSSIPVWNELEAMGIDSTCSYMIEDNNVVLYRNAPQVGAEIMVKIITPFSELSDTDNVTVPGGKNEMLFQRMYSFMSLRKNIKTEYNDNNSDQKLG